MAAGASDYPPAPAGGRLRVLSPSAAAELSADEKAKIQSFNFLDGSTHRGYSVEKAERELGWKPRPMEEWCVTLFLGYSSATATAAASASGSGSASASASAASASSASSASSTSASSSHSCSSVKLF